ncbi:hypothetical protein ACS0TY_014915 [Phlomoides rotata]
MGNYRFRLSDMMPNAWFYKLRDMSKLKNQPIKKNLPSSTLNPRKSFYYTTDSTRRDNNLCNSPKFFDTPFPPRKSSSKKKSKRKTIYMPSPRKITPSVIFQDGPPTSSDDDQDFIESLSEFDPYDDDSIPMSPPWPCSCELASDIIIDVDETSSYASINTDRLTEFKLISELELPPIVTKSKKSESPKLKKNRGSEGRRKSVSRSGGVRIRRNGRRKSVRSSEKRGLFYSESLAVVKASFDPEKDFKDSMMEMIVENNIRESKDLEDLLASYLSLNHNQYHHHIIKAFEQIWFHIPR